MSKFLGQLKEVQAIQEWLETRELVPAPRHIYLMLLTGHGKRRWSVVHLLTEEQYATKSKVEWEARGCYLHPNSIQGLWFHAPAPEVKP